MPATRFPRPLAPGDTVAVTSPSSGVGRDSLPRLEFALGWLRDRGYDVVVGDCMSGERVRSAPVAQRAEELTRFLCDPAVAAVVPPFGGELAIDLLGALDWDRLAAADPTWLVGWSDLSTLMLPLTLRLGWATAHGWNLMDTPLAPPAGLLHWTDVLSRTGEVTQRSPGLTRDGWGDWRAADTTVMTLDQTTDWVVLGGGDVDVSGTLVGGCLETLSPLAGTPYGDVPGYGDGLLVYLEAAESDAYGVARMLHGLRYAGWFDHANGVLVGRTSAPDSPDLAQLDAVEEVLGDLGIPVVAEMDIGHTQPFLTLVNGAHARVVVRPGVREVTQRLG